MMNGGDEACAKRVLGLLDLTSLNADDDAETIVRLCKRAVTAHGPVAAVCVWPRFVGLAKSLLAETRVKVAAVANFPTGGCDPVVAAREAAEITAAGGDEVDLVFPYNAWLSGDHSGAIDVVRICRNAIGSDVVLKVILETGCLQRPDVITAAARAAIEAGADFIKTSTGKTAVGATPESALAMMRAIADSGSVCGFKASGGVTRLAAAKSYLGIADDVMGSAWSRPDRFRFGASSLLDDLLAVLDGRPPGFAGSGY